jgi:protocatechuate 3,4-dioxygenase, alpha subunit
MSPGQTPAQTVGPYLAIGLTWPDGPYAAEPGSPGAFWLRGRLLDGGGDPVPDGMVEIWQADRAGRFDHPDDPRGAVLTPGFRGFARSLTDGNGRWAVHTVKPGPLPDEFGEVRAPHIDVSVFARGLLDRVVTRVYFADEQAANARDDTLRALPDDASRATLIAQPSDDGYQLDITLQGPDETVFFRI